MSRRKGQPPKTSRKYGFRTPRGRKMKQAAFLKAFAKCGVVTRAAEAVGIDRHLHAHWMRDDPEYAEAFADAQEQAADMLEAEAVRRATQGVMRLKFHNGEPIIDPQTGQQYAENEYSDTLLIFLLKGARPAKFRERREISGPDGGPIPIAKVEDLTDAQLALIAARGLALPAPQEPMEPATEEAIANDAT